MKVEYLERVHQEVRFRGWSRLLPEVLWISSSVLGILLRNRKVGMNVRVRLQEQRHVLQKDIVKLAN